MFPVLQTFNKGFFHVFLDFPKANFIVCTSPLSAGGEEGGLGLRPNFQKEGLDKILIFRGVAGKEGATFFKGLQFFT